MAEEKPTIDCRPSDPANLVTQDKINNFFQPKRSKPPPPAGDGAPAAAATAAAAAAAALVTAIAAVKTKICDTGEFKHSSGYMHASYTRAS